MDGDYFQIPDTLEELCSRTIGFHDSAYSKIPERVIKNREKISEYSRKFHEEAGTLSSGVCSMLENMSEEGCILIMSAHQPNFFPYSGVMRKLSVLDALGDEIGSHGRKYAEFFGISDQDITESWRWQKESHLPSIEKKKGCHSLFCSIPDSYSRKIYYSVPKPSVNEKESWKKEIKSWMVDNIKSIEKNGVCIPEEKKKRISDEYENFSRLIDNAYEHSGSLSDFNSFVMSGIANSSWGNDTIFARFYEFDEIFGSEFSRLLFMNSEYQKHLKDAVMNVEGKVPEKKAPFWYHCECAGKVGLDVSADDTMTAVSGTCPCCGNYYDFSFANDELGAGEGLKEIENRISPRARTVPIILMDGLGIACFVGGKGGSMKYMAETKRIAENMGMSFPVYVSWLPFDCYCGLGQLNAFSEAGKHSDSHGIAEGLEKIQKRLSYIESIRMKERNEILINYSEVSERIKEIDRNFADEKKELALEKAKLLKIPDSLKIRPSIADYAINIGIEKTGKEWKRLLKESGFSEKYTKLDSIIGMDEEIMDFMIREMKDD